MRRIYLGLAYDKKCAEHGALGMLPCAFPGCSNGIVEDEFEEEPLIADREATSWRRREWQSPFGVYYSWESGDLPNWFHATQTFWNEAMRLKLVPESFPSTVYHYTSLDGFVGIVGSRSVWMTEFRTLTIGARFGMGWTFSLRP